MNRGLAILLTVLCMSAARADSLLPDGLTSLDEFNQIAVLSNGRKMPLHTFARLTLIQFSGRVTYQGAPAEEWLAQILFDPPATLEQRIFLINHPGVVQALGIEEAEKRRYSFADLHEKMPRLRELAERAARLEQEDRSEVETELIRLFANVNNYLDLFKSFEFARPHPDFAIENDELRNVFDFPDGRTAFSFADIFFNVGQLQGVIDPLGHKPQEEWTDLEQSAFWLSNNLFVWAQRYQGLPFTIIPIAMHGEESWLAPWDTIALGLRDPGLQNAVRALTDMSRAYRAGRQLEFDMAAKEFRRIIHNQLTDDREMEYLALEVLFNRLELFRGARLFYFFAFLLAFISFLTRSRWPIRIALALLVIALGYHTVGMVMRMMIMGRPPMTNLYATFIFVSWVTVVLGLIVEGFQRNSVGALVSSVSGAILLAVSERFYLQGDTMGQVVAVLDSNFWLSTHVTTITAGYAGCLLAGVIGHLYLLQAAIAPARRDRLQGIYYAMIGMLGFGLTLSFLGTMLGGVWADQSWGRFWGWDPKENGALLIVLWCSILFHARVGKIITPIGMAAGCVLGAVVVMMAWLGVNLLGVGLHSYGFTSGLAFNLFLYSGLEILFVAIFTPWAARRLATP